ncbi:Pkinase-domain-containing protein [Ramicandelaber brevisporus]|nr:Pkinase-domain-containing protein [Ramicandelaber brevisporus]
MATKELVTIYSAELNGPIAFQIGNVIGKGQFGTVYRALNLETAQMVAFKRIPLSNKPNEQVDEMMREVELLQSLSHPRIVQYIGYLKTSNHLDIVLEYVENGSLYHTLKAFGEFSEKLVLAYVVKILEGLVYLHDMNVVHCDLKAANILTTKNGNTKLTDFGVSLSITKRANGEDDDSEAANHIAGTPNWMAPEVISLRGVSTKSDIWSLGCTIIELLTGRPPYHGLNPLSAMYHIVEDDGPTLPDDLSTQLQSFLEMCFRKDPSERPSAAELMRHPWIRQAKSEANELKALRRENDRMCRQQPVVWLMAQL